MASAQPLAPHQGILWVPNAPGHFITWSTELRLYHLRSIADVPGWTDNLDPRIWVKVSDKHVAENLAVLPEPPHYIKCVAIHPAGVQGNIHDLHLAVGQANGRISLVTLDSQKQIKEFSPKALRQCNDVTWNAASPILLAGGFEKSRNDAGILVFDTEKSAVMATVTTQARFTLSGVKEEKSSYVKAINEMALGDTCYSLSWLCQRASAMSVDEKVRLGSEPTTKKTNGEQEASEDPPWFAHSPMVLVAGVNGKNLKVFDIRQDQSNRAVQTTFTRAVYGACVDPFMESRVASHFENQVVIWDLRNFERPIVTLNQHQKVAKMEWCPTRSGLLCSSLESGPTLTLHDIQSWSHSNEEGEPWVTEREIGVVRPITPEEVVTVINPKPDVSEKKSLSQSQTNNQRYGAFAFALDDSSRIMTFTSEVPCLKEVRVTERMSLNWSNQHCVVWPQSRKLRTAKLADLRPWIPHDISIKMQGRASEGFGSYQGLQENAEILEQMSDAEDVGLIDVFRTVSISGSLAEDCGNRFYNLGKFPGLVKALGLETGANSEPKQMHWKGAVDDDRKFNCFTSARRILAGKLCGWSGFDETSLKLFVKKCEDNKEYSRAACVAMFCWDLTLAKASLELGVTSMATIDPAKSEHLNLTFLTLSLYLERGRSESVRASVANIQDPYLRAMFAFLTSIDENEANQSILGEEIDFKDRMAFACMYLSDQDLVISLNKFWKDFMVSGDLRGLLLCGMESEQCSRLLQRYIDVSGDVQTASILAARCFNSQMLSESGPRLWLTEYRNLLDSWRLWNHRAEFDIAAEAALAPFCAAQQVYISCAYCGSNVSRSATNVNVVQNPLARRQDQARRKNLSSQVCQTCRRPLPRCSVCLITMGSITDWQTLDLKGHQSKSKTNHASDAFSYFFTWCQTCRHGGHAIHLNTWFEDNNECPVFDCSCNCVEVDNEVDAF